jgi:uncharacterized protein YkwD
MRTSRLAAAVITAALALTAAAAEASDGPQPPRVPASGTSHLSAKVSPRSDAWEAKVLKLTNKRRVAHGRKPLKASRCADGFAEPWTRHLARRQVLKHQSLTPFLSCPHTSYAGENIAYGYETPRALVSAWMHSPGHRANILSRHFHRIGVSGWRAANGQTYATQDFLG